MITSTVTSQTNPSRDHCAERCLTLSVNKIKFLIIISPCQWRHWVWTLSRWNFFSNVFSPLFPEESIWRRKFCVRTEKLPFGRIVQCALLVRWYFPLLYIAHFKVYLRFSGASATTNELFAVGFDTSMITPQWASNQACYDGLEG